MKEEVLLCADGGSTRLLVGVVVGGRITGQSESPSHVAHGVSILDRVTEALSQSGTTPEQLTGLAMAAGPGSFTGLRTVMSTFKGLALGWSKPLMAVSTLHALARSPGLAEGAWVSACLDARKGEIYGALFRLGTAPEDDHVALPPCVMAASAWAQKLLAFPRAVLVGDGQARFPVELPGESVWPQAVPDLRAIARCAVRRLPMGDPLESLEPFYVRRSYADLALGRPATVENP